jgi:hypothetical protein
MQCPNCGQEFKGRFCTNCGQDNIGVLSAADNQGARHDVSSSADPDATAVIKPADVGAVAATEGSPPSPKNTLYPRPPLRTGQLFNDSFHLYRRNLPLLAGSVGVLAILQGLLTVFLHIVGAPSAAGAALTLVFLPASMGVLAVPITARYLERSISIGEVYATIGMFTLGMLVIGSLLYGLVVLAGTVLVVIPGIYLLIRFLFAPQVIVLERANVKTAFSRSADLVKGSWWRVFGHYLLFNLPAIPGVIVVGLVMQLLSHAASSGAADIWILISTGFLIPLIIFPIPISATVMLYYDLRVRKEAFEMGRAVAAVSRD